VGAGWVSGNLGKFTLEIVQPELLAIVFRRAAKLYPIWLYSGNEARLLEDSQHECIEQDENDDEPVKTLALDLQQMHID